MEAARRAAQELSAEIVVIAKTSPRYAALENRPPCPSVALDLNMLVTDGTITFDDLKEAMEAGGGGAA